MTARRSSGRGQPQATWKDPRRRPELLKAIGAGAGVVLLTALIIFLIQPGELLVDDAHAGRRPDPGLEPPDRVEPPDRLDPERLDRLDSERLDRRHRHHGVLAHGVLHHTAAAMTAASPRPAFEAGLGFALDPFQRRALDALDAGQSVLVAAPTGSGKTIVAEYAATLALAERDEGLLHDAR